VAARAGAGWPSPIASLSLKAVTPPYAETHLGGGVSITYLLQKDYLTTSRRVMLASDQPVTLVIGNEAADLDSCVRRRPILVGSTVAHPNADQSSSVCCAATAGLRVQQKSHRRVNLSSWHVSTPATRHTLKHHRASPPPLFRFAGVVRAVCVRAEPRRAAYRRARGSRAQYPTRRPVAAPRRRVASHRGMWASFSGVPAHSTSASHRAVR